MLAAARKPRRRNQSLGPERSHALSLFIGSFGLMSGRACYPMGKQKLLADAHQLTLIIPVRAASAKPSVQQVNAIRDAAR
jgi:hypothetical protein